MTSNLSQFHYLASTVPNKFDFEAEDFDVSQIYQFYSLKVSKKYSRATGVYSLKLQRFSDLFPFTLFTAPKNACFSVPRQNVRPEVG